MKTHILSIGNEILRGDIQDTNAQWLSKNLALLGCDIVGHRALGDCPKNLKKEFKKYARRESLVIVTGGLGPTDDDITREVVTEVAGVTPVLNKRAWDEIVKRFAKKGSLLQPSNKRQALLPAGCTPFYNSCGTAPGFAVQIQKTIFILMPGVPYEMKEMYRLSAVPYLQKKLSLKQPPFIKRFKLHGIGESQATALLGDLLERDKEPRVDITVQHSVLSLSIIAQRTNTYRNEVQKICRLIRTQLGEHIFSEKGLSLPEVITSNLLSQQQTLATVESCTGGMIASELLGVTGASSVFTEGAITYCNASKERTVGVNKKTLTTHGAVSEETALEMAQGMLIKSETDFALSTTGIAGPDGGTKDKPVGTVCFALAQKNAPTQTWTKHFTGTRNQVRLRATNWILHRLFCELTANKNLL